MESFSSSKTALIEHFRAHSLRTDGPFLLSSGNVSDWYLDGRQTTYDGVGARLVGICIRHLLVPEATAVGGLTMGADPVAISTALITDPPLVAFSVRKEAKHYGVGGRVVGPVTPGDRAVVVDDTTTTGTSLVEATEVLRSEGIEVIQALVVVDRSFGAADNQMAALDVRYEAVLVPEDLGVEPEARA